MTYVNPDDRGLITKEVINKAITDRTALVSIMHVNNELGTINPIEEIGRLCCENEILFHSDAAQSLCKVPIDVDKQNIDLMSFSAHKIGGPKGIGAIYIRDLRANPIYPVIHGAGQEEGLRGGTVAAPLIQGFGAALTHFSKYYLDFEGTNIKDYLTNELTKNKITYFVNGTDALPHLVSLTLPETDTQSLIVANADRLCLAQGSACSSKTMQPSHVLKALGLSSEHSFKTYRISFNLNVNKREVDFLINQIIFWSQK